MDHIISTSIRRFQQNELYQYCVQANAFPRLDIANAVIEEDLQETRSVRSSLSLSVKDRASHRSLRIDMSDSESTFHGVCRWLAEYRCLWQLSSSSVVREVINNVKYICCAFLFRGRRWWIQRLKAYNSLETVFHPKPFKHFLSMHLIAIGKYLFRDRKRPQHLCQVNSQ